METLVPVKEAHRIVEQRKDQRLQSNIKSVQLMMTDRLTRSYWVLWHIPCTGWEDECFYPPSPSFLFWLRTAVWALWIPTGNLPS